MHDCITIPSSRSSNFSPREQVEGRHGHLGEWGHDDGSEWDGPFDKRAMSWPRIQAEPDGSVQLIKTHFYFDLVVWLFGLSALSLSNCFHFSRAYLW